MKTEYLISWHSTNCEVISPTAIAYISDSGHDCTKNGSDYPQLDVARTYGCSIVRHGFQVGIDCDISVHDHLLHCTICHLPGHQMGRS